MNDIALKVENLTKEYRLGLIGHGTLREDMQSAWARFRGKEDPNSLVTAKHNTDSDMKHFLALDDISFNIKKGDRVGIIGKNGAGKSTLLKILSRITSPTKGNIYINGRIGSLLEVGTGFHGELTGRENIYLNGAIMGMKKWEIDKKFDEIVDFSGVEKFIDTPVKRYSSGMFVRLGFAVAAHLEPEILIVDEVLAVGDVEFQKKALGKMEVVSNNDGRTILFVSHNMGNIIKLCNSSIILDNGIISYSGSVNEGVNHYLSVKEDNNCYYDYSSSKERSGNFNILIENLSFLKDSILCHTFLSGDMFTIMIKYKINCDILNKHVNFLISIKDSLGEPVALLGSDLSSENISFNGLIKCVIPKLQLNQGGYLINLCVKVDGVISDWIMDAASFQVLPGRYYSSGRLPPRDYGPFLIDHCWKS